MIRIKLIPDGGAGVPAEAKDHGILAANLEAASNIPDGSPAPISGWRDVDRVVPGRGEYVALRIPGEPTDYPGDSLDAIKNAILNNVNGLKAHPNGWEYVGEG